MDPPEYSNVSSSCMETTCRAVCTRVRPWKAALPLIACNADRLATAVLTGWPLVALVKLPDDVRGCKALDRPARSSHARGLELAVEEQSEACLPRMLEHKWVVLYHGRL